MKRILFFVALAVLSASFLWAAGETEAAQPIVVGSKIDTEGALLGQMIVLMLNSEGYAVEDRTEFGTTDVIRKAIKTGEIDVYPEYTGNGGFFFDTEDPTIWKNAERAWQTVKELDKEQNDIVWLQPANANNTWAIATREELARREDVYTLEDFARYENEGGTVKLAGSEEFVSRPDALPAFEEAYGFELESDQLVILSGGNTAQTERAAADGTDGVNFAMAYGTDGAISALDLIVLEDTKGVQPVYQPAPIVRREVLDLYPEIPEVLNPVFESLDLETLQTLNGRIVVEGILAETVARDYLEQEGFLQ